MNLKLPLHDCAFENKDSSNNTQLSADQNFCDTCFISAKLPKCMYSQCIGILISLTLRGAHNILPYHFAHLKLDLIHFSISD